MITPDAYRQMRTQILDRFCVKLEHTAPAILQRCDEPVLLAHARRMYSEGGSPLPGDVGGKSELIDRIIHAAEIFLVHSVEQQLLWMGNFEEEQKRIEAAVAQQYEAWIGRFESWS